MAQRFTGCRRYCPQREWKDVAQQSKWTFRRRIICMDSCWRKPSYESLVREILVRLTFLCGGMTEIESVEMTAKLWGEIGAISKIQKRHFQDNAVPSRFFHVPFPVVANQFAVIWMPRTRNGVNNMKIGAVVNLVQKCNRRFTFLKINLGSKENSDCLEIKKVFKLNEPNIFGKYFLFENAVSLISFFLCPNFQTCLSNVTS